MRLKEMGSRAGDIIMLDPEMIEEKEGYNVRDMESEATQAYIRQMVDSIHAGGTAAFPEITVRQEDGKVYVTRGHCRRRAFVIARQEGAEIKGIRAIADTIKGDAEHTLDLLNSNDGLPLTPLEKATAIKRLISFEWSISEVAKRRGCTPQAISNLLALLDAPAPVVKMVEKGEVSATLAVDTVRKEGSMFASDKLQTAVETANKQGKKHATAKHLPKSTTPNPSRITPEPAGEPQHKHKFSWDEYGPKVKDHLEAVCHAFPTNNHLNVTRARDFLKEMDKMGL